MRESRQSRQSRHRRHRARDYVTGHRHTAKSTLSHLLPTHITQRRLVSGVGLSLCLWIMLTERIAYFGLHKVDCIFQIAFFRLHISDCTQSRLTQKMSRNLMLFRNCNIISKSTVIYWYLLVGSLISVYSITR